MRKVAGSNLLFVLNFILYPRTYISFYLIICFCLKFDWLSLLYLDQETTDEWVNDNIRVASWTHKWIREAQDREGFQSERRPNTPIQNPRYFKSTKPSINENLTLFITITENNKVTTKN